MSESLEVATAEGAISVRIDGEPGKPWLLMSNSLAADMSMWTQQLPAFGARRRVVRYDTRGHGASSAPPGPYDFAGLVADVVAILDHLDIAQTDVIGLSLGGATALGLGLARPERVRKLVCCCARAIYPAPALQAWDQRIAQVAAGGVESVIEETLPRWFTPETLAARPELAAQARRMMATTSRAGYIGCVEALKSLAYFDKLPSLHVETLFVAGERDGGVPPQAMQETAATVPGAKFGIVPGAAHIANMENASAFDALVLAFLAQ